MSANIDPLNIPHFVSGNVGNLDYSHINSLVDRINALSGVIGPDVVSLIGVLRQNANQNTQQKTLHARIGNSNSELSSQQRKYWHWEEVWYSPVTGSFERASNGRNSEDGQYAVSLDAPEAKHTGKIVQLRSHNVSDGIGQSEVGDVVMIFRGGSLPTSTMAMATIVSGTDDELGAPYDAILQPMEDAELPDGQHVIINAMELSNDPLFGSEIDAQNCESEPVIETLRLPEGTRALVHYWRTYENDVEVTINEWRFNASIPVRVECDCPDPNEEQSGYAGTFEQQMLGN